jgi:hypothetical protein
MTVLPAGRLLPSRSESVEQAASLQRAAGLPTWQPQSTSRQSGPGSSTSKRPFIATQDEVLRYIVDYPEHLELDRISHDGDVVHFALSRCPFKGGPHRDMRTGHGKVTIALYPTHLGFKCFSEDHAQLKFYDLYQWLIQQTGRRTTAKLWGPEPGLSIEDMNRIWGVGQGEIEPG